MGIQDYLKSLNPKDDRLKYNTEYQIYKDGKSLGIATWIKDENVGDSFQTKSISKSGELVTEVYVPDTWEEINEISHAREVYPDCSLQFACGVHTWINIGKDYDQRGIYQESEDFRNGFYQAQKDLGCNYKMKR